jgi:hypothetical protein
MKMKKLLALLVMAVLSISAASAVEYPAWWEKMGAGESLTLGSYSTINAYADEGPGFDAKTATTNYVVNQEGTPAISMVNSITTKSTGDQQSEVYRQLLSQTGSASVYQAPDPVYDSECPTCKITQVEAFEQEQVALFSGDLDCPDKTFGATFSNNNVIGDAAPGNELHQTSGSDSAQVFGYGYDVNIIEAYAGQTTSGSLVETSCTVPGSVDPAVTVKMSGAASLFAGFDNAIVDDGNGNEDYIKVQLSNGNGDKFWWED